MKEMQMIQLHCNKFNIFDFLTSKQRSEYPNYFTTQDVHNL